MMQSQRAGSVVLALKIVVGASVVQNGQGSDEKDASCFRYISKSQLFHRGDSGGLESEGGITVRRCSRINSR